MEYIQGLPDIKYIHIGFHRCASTTIQTDILFATKQIAYSKNGRLIMRPTLQDISTFYNNIPPQADKKYVVSAESLCGVGYMSPNASNAWKSTPADIHKNWPKAKILICIRRQYELIRSYHSLAIIKGLTTVNFQKYMDENFYKDYLKYDKFISSYIGLFGESSVHVIPFEWLSEDRRKFLLGLSNFLDIDVTQSILKKHNSGGSDAANEVFRILNYAFRILGYQRKMEMSRKRLRQALTAILPKHRFYLKPADVDELRKYYYSSNQRTSELIGVDLINDLAY